ncbi:MAG TPA: carboxypeptidase regulatory-like domain-containing protein [Planctomycetota bacterium]|nr:carboxypeptidase regulatory-like domain-containing protein [Planctomycetota bacterium]
MPRSRSWILALAALVCAGALLWLARSVSPAPPTVPDRAAPAVPRPLPPPDVPTASERASVAPDEAPPAAPLAPTVSGRVVDAAGNGVPGVAVGVADEEAAPTARTGSDGTFQLAPETLPCLFAVTEPGWTTLELGEVREDAPLEPARVVAVRAVALEGIVVDRGERPIPGARLSATPLPETTVPGLHGKWGTSSGLEGRFAFETVPALPRVRVRTWLQGWKTDEREIDLSGTDATRPALHVVLDADDPTGPVLEGKVVRPDGAPARGALVAFGAARARTGADGAFRLMCTWFDAATPLVACERGFQPAILPGYGARADPLARSLAAETIVLPGKELEIEGRVVFKNGAPCKGWRVVVADATFLDPGGSSRDVAETEVSGRPEVKTDSRGGFRVTGLAARSYTLLATGRNAFVRAEVAVRSDPTSAGSRGLVLVAPDGNPGETIRGRVVTASGKPVAGALLGLGRPVLAGSPAQFAWQGRFRTVAGPDGAFEIAGTPACFEFVVASADWTLPARLALEPGAPRTNLEIQLGERRSFSFDAHAASPRPDRLRALTAAGAPTPIWTVDAAVPIPTGVALLAEGRSGSLAVAEDASTLVVYRGAVELGRLQVPGADGSQVVWP